MVKKQKLYSGHTHYEREMFLPYFDIMNLEIISPTEQCALKPLTGTWNFSFQLSEQQVSLETPTANSKHIGELQSYCGAN